MDDATPVTALVRVIETAMTEADFYDPEGVAAAVLAAVAEPGPAGRALREQMCPTEMWTLARIVKLCRSAQSGVIDANGPMLQQVLEAAEVLLGDSISGAEEAEVLLGDSISGAEEAPNG